MCYLLDLRFLNALGKRFSASSGSQSVWFSPFVIHFYVFFFFHLSKKVVSFIPLCDSSFPCIQR